MVRRTVEVVMETSVPELLPAKQLSTDYRKKHCLYAFFSVRELQYTPEELLAMMLNYSCGLAQDFAGRFAHGARCIIV